MFTDVVSENFILGNTEKYMKIKLILFRAILFLKQFYVQTIVYSSLFFLFPLSVPAKNSTIKYPDREFIEITDEVRAQRGGTYIKLSQGITHYQLSGPTNGDIVVLIHGASLSLWVWDRQIASLHEAGYRTLRYDQYSRGLSDYPHIIYDRDHYRIQLLELLKALSIDTQVTIIAHSFGGLITSYFAASHPKIVKKIILISPGVTVSGIVKFMVKSFIGKIYVRHNIKNLNETIETRLKHQHIPIDPYKNIYLNQISVKGFEYSVISLFSNAIDDYLPYYKEIGKNGIPTLIIKGTNDKVIKEKHIEMAIDVMPNSKYITLKDIGHVPQFEATEQFNPILLEFLKKEN